MPKKSLIYQIKTEVCFALKISPLKNSNSFFTKEKRPKFPVFENREQQEKKLQKFLSKERKVKISREIDNKKKIVRCFIPKTAHEPR